MPLVKIERQQYPKVCEVYQSGKTLKETASIFGISRERVRQILEEKGINGKTGGAHRRVLNREKKLNESFFKKYGCTKEQFLSVKGERSDKSKAPYYAYLLQKRNAHIRGVEWNFLFWDWWCVWVDSGKWDLRGRGTGGYCMCRIGDEGPYERGNVYISTVTHNSRLGRTLATERADRPSPVLEIIRSAGGPSAVGRAIGIKANYLSQLAGNNTIPEKWIFDGKAKTIADLTNGTFTVDDIRKVASGR
ncbi:hypothetical protein GHU73_12120 [Citrobacter werkmanii]|nr:sigma factor-like helix-turn-helix DNA-binding protein [Citrobacter werkmanii]MBJ9598087.1 hypothetical protein [Citrobacter werkmanii]